MKKFSTTKGFMTVEIIMGLSIVTLSVLAFLNVAERSIRVAKQSTESTQAAFLLEEGAEVVRVLRDTDWNNIASLTAGTNYYPALSGSTWSLSTTPNSVGMFSRAVSFSPVARESSTGDISATGANDPGTKLVSVTVSWSRGGEVLTKTLQFYIMDIF
ncbi:MAG: hypothetical protein WD991_00835 [Candidatus Paceibacterota bacterium]